jgi:hypothetical protein
MFLLHMQIRRYFNKMHVCDNGYYKIINSANIKKTKPISEKLSQYRYWLSFFILDKFMILYCKDSLGCVDNNNIELINNWLLLLRPHDTFNSEKNSMTIKR